MKTKVALALCLLSFALALPTLRAECVTAPSGLIAWWRAENNALDSAGSNQGAISGATFAPGQVGQAFSFDGFNDGVVVADAAALRPLTNLTIEAWIKTAGIPGSSLAGFVVARSGNGFSGYEFGVGTPSQAGRLRFGFNGGAGGADMFSTNGVTDNALHHIAATYDGTTMRIYRDGLLDGANAFNQPIAYASGDPLWIGRREFALIPGHFAGLIDEPAIYNRVLSASEIAALHAAGSNGKCAGPTLQIAALPGAVRLSWLTNSATGFTLETNGPAFAPGSWNPPGLTPVVTSNEFVVTNAATSPARNYRLRKP